MKKIIIYTVLAVVSLSSCKKFLEQPPYNNVSLDDIFADYQGARTTLVGLYDKLKSTNYYLLDFYVYPELAGGNVKYSRTSNQYMYLSYSFTRDSVNNEMENFYNQAYSIIYGANNIIENVNKATDANSFQKARLLADAYTIRAMVHFDLVRTFAQQYNFTSNASHPGIVIKNKNTSVLTPTPPAASVKEVYDQVLKDLDSAKALYARSVAIFTSPSRTFLSADAAKALLNRVSLYKEDWQTVITTATELITSGQYPLTSNAQYVNSWSKKNIANESIFELAYGTNIGGSYGDYFNPANTLRAQFAASNDLLSLYSSTDVRGTASFYVPTTVNAVTYYYTKKYQGINDSANNIKVIRLSEIYLNRAEAYARSGNLTAALADLNLIRKRGDASAADITTGTQQFVINEILKERRKELAFEGHLFFDIARTKQDLVRTDATSAIKSFTYPNPLFAYPKPIIQ